MEEPNVLLLDEPTNDLDIETMAVLENFIDDFNGAIIFVSHDRFFVDRLAGKVFAYEAGGNLRMYAGGYSYYKEKMAEEETPSAPAAETLVKKPKEKPTVAENRKHSLNGNSPSRSRRNMRKLKALSPVRKGN